MGGGEHQDEWRAWVISASAGQEAFKFVAPVQPPGWEEPGWVELRPLNLREALGRDSLGLRDEYEIGADGRVLGMRRSYGLEAMVRLDLEHCLVDALLPGENVGGVCLALDGEALRASRPSDLPGRVGTELVDWLLESIEAVNMRRPADSEVIRAAKERLRALAQGAREPGPMGEEDARGSLREGRDFASSEELADLLSGGPGRWVRTSIAEELAACVHREMSWLAQGGGLPGGVSWDRQPAWRVELWETFLAAGESTSAAWAANPAVVSDRADTPGLASVAEREVVVKELAAAEADLPTAARGVEVDVPPVRWGSRTGQRESAAVNAKRRMTARRGAAAQVPLRGPQAETGAWVAQGIGGAALQHVASGDPERTVTAVRSREGAGMEGVAEARRDAERANMEPAAPRREACGDAECMTEDLARRQRVDCYR